MAEPFAAPVPRLAGRRVLLLFPHAVAPGGALTYTLRLARALLAQGARVGLATLRVEEGAWSPPPGLEVLSLGGPLSSSLAYWGLFPYWQRRLDRVISAWRPDVVVPQVFPSNWWGWVYKRRHPGTRIAWFCHEPSAHIHSADWRRALRPRWKSFLAEVLSPPLAWLDRRLVRSCDRIVANSDFTAAEMGRVYGLSPDAVARPGIDLQAFSGPAVPKEPALLTVARLTQFKRIGFLLEVFRHLLDLHPELTYQLVGTGEDEGEFRALAAHLGLGGRVVFHGAVDDPTLAGLYARSTLFLHGSVAEPFGIAPLEAIASGTPVVAHRSGGPLEYVTDGCGRLIASVDAEEWVRVIAGYLDLLAAVPDFPARVRECARAHDWSASLRPGLETIAALCGEGPRVRR